MSSEQGRIIKISGPLVIADGMRSQDVRFVRDPK